MKVLLIALLLPFYQSQIKIVKNNGDEIVLTEVLIFQTDKKGSPNSITYKLRDKEEKIMVKSVRRISFKESLGKKKGIATYRVILVKDNNDKLDVEIDLVKIQGKNENGKMESLGLGSVDKISF